MTDSIFAPETEDEHSRESQELLPDPGFESSLFDAIPESESPREGAGISEETLFPADPIFSSDEDAQSLDLPLDNDASEQDDEGKDPLLQGENLLEDAEEISLFDPIVDTAQAPDVEEKIQVQDEELGLFYVPESEKGEDLSTAAFYAASELRAEDEQPLENVGDGDCAESKTTVSNKTKKRKTKRAVKPARELSDEEILLRRSDAEREVGYAKGRFTLAAIILFLLAVFEILSSFGVRVTIPLGLSRIPGAEALIDLQLLLLLSLCAYRSIIAGVRSIFTGRLRFEGILVLLLIFTVIYDVSLYAFAVREPVLCGLVLAVPLCVTVWLDMVESRVAVGILGLMADSDGVSAALPSEDGERLSVSNVSYADGYDEHNGDHEENAHGRFLFLLGSLAIGVLALIAAVVFEKGDNPFSAALAAVLLSLPSGAFLARRIYLSAMQQSLLRRRTALVGESAAVQAASIGVFSLDDAEAFDADDLKIKIVNVFGDFRLDEAIRLMAGVYRPIGGALSKLLSKMCEEAGGPCDASIVNVLEDGVIAHADGRTVAVGTRRFMAENGVHFPSDVGEDSLLAGERLTVLYASVDGVIVVRLFIEYTLSADFENLADHLARLGCSIELRTADPCLSAEYLLRLSTLPRNVLVLRRLALSELLSERSDRVTSCFFTADHPRSLVGAWLAFRRYLLSRRHGEVLSALQLLAGAALFGVAVFGFGTPIVPIGLSALYHLATVLAAIGGARAFRLRLEEELPDTESKGTIS